MMFPAYIQTVFKSLRGHSHPSAVSTEPQGRVTASEQDSPIHQESHGIFQETEQEAEMAPANSCWEDIYFLVDGCFTRVIPMDFFSQMKLFKS